MSRILDIDMDFFLNNIAIEKHTDNRLASEDYIPWREEEFRLFLEKRCNLDKMKKIPGRIVIEHDETFYFLKELIDKNEIKVPFEITHIDAHTDLKSGYPNTALKYIHETLLHIPMNERLKRLNTSQMNSANYLSYAIACGLFNKVELVMHPDYKYDVDLPTRFFKDEDYRSNYLELKGYKYMLNPNAEPLTIDKKIPFKIIRGDEYRTNVNFDYLVLCQSPTYTPPIADYMLEVIKDYIIEV